MFLAMVLVPTLAFAQTAPRITRSNPEGLLTPGGYSHVVEVTGPARTVYVAGQLPVDAKGTVVGARDMKAQAEQVFKNLETALAAAGARFDDVVKMNTYVTDISQIQAIRDVRARYFRSGVPASTLVQVGALARPDCMLEIEVVAVVAP
jgi:reactive intermediate/imine deaminase